MADSSTPASGTPAPFGRILTAMVTPFTPSGDLDLDAAQRLASHLVDAGNDGLVVSGTTGESPTTTDAEKDALLRAVLEAVGDRATVLAGTGTNDTRHASELSQQAEKAGAHGLLVVTPYYNKPPQEGLLAHFRAVADSTGLPVMLYDIPGRTGMAIATETLVAAGRARPHRGRQGRQGRHRGHDRGAGGGPTSRTTAVPTSGISPCSRWAPSAWSAWSVTWPRGEYAQMADAVDAGDLATARAIDRRLVPAYQAIMTRTQGAIMAKAALEVLGVLSTRRMRLPLVAATDDEVSRLRTDLRGTGS